MVGGKKAASLEKAIYELSKRRALEDDSTNPEELYQKIAYQKLGHIVSVATDKKASKESISAKLKLITKEIEEDCEGWICLVFKSEEERFLRMMESGLKKPEATKGLYWCKNRKCTVKDEFFVWRKQTRSADEPETTFFQCAHCGKRGKHG